MCGIIAWSGKDPKKFNQDKFNIIGIFNESRGGDSCGVAVDGEIYYGVDKDKHFEKFIINKGYPKPKVIPAVIGHTRKSSVGIATVNNAHPFGYGELNEGYEFIGCKNGTLSNYEDLAKEFGIDITVYKNNVYDRRKNDSEVLLEILYKSHNVEVLEKYIGGAAIVCQDLNNPEIIYAYHGASKKETTDITTTLYEERPLYYYQESLNSVYISSLIEPLLFLGGVEDENVFEFKHNLLYEIKNGNVAAALKHKVDRSNSGQKAGYVNTYNKNTYVKEVEKNIKNTIKTFNNATNRIRQNVANIFNEKENQTDFLSPIFYHRLRYKRAGHNITGIYTWIKDFGFYKIDDHISNINSKINNITDKYFSLLDKEFVKDEYVDKQLKKEALFIPFTNIKSPGLYYFHEGIMLETELDYTVIQSNTHKYSFEDLSTMSKYPICGKHKSKDEYQNIRFNNQLYTNNFTPIGSKNIYVIENGNLINIERIEQFNDTSEQTVETNVIKLPFPFTCCDNPQIPIVVTDYNKETVEWLSEKDLIEEEFDARNSPDFALMEIINENFTPIYEELQILHENLKDNPSQDIQDLIELGKEYLIGVDCITEQFAK